MILPEYQEILDAAEAIKSGQPVWALQIFACETCNNLSYMLREDHPHPQRPLILLHNSSLAKLLSGDFDTTLIGGL